ncbi:Ig-like domain-containing protein [Phaeodactylibacter luteus]|nr:Ig-like domain-containing protein [Phaeodactylibacter luteus]
MRVLLAALLAFALWQCANPVRPEGGPKDEDPPRLVREKSSPNERTRYVKSPIELTFTEWVEIRDAFNQVVISPPLEYRYELSIKGKTVIFEFDEREELRENATYTINFGTAIQDITERNPAENLRYVFSTGEYIDSLRVGGLIVDARTGAPVEDVLFMLYENTADSVVRTERPFYFARSGKDGAFLIENVKAGQFKGFALLDNNLNYLFDQATEAIAFPDTLLTVAEGQEPTVVVRLFTERPPLLLLEDNSREYGQVRLSFNRSAEEVDISWEDVGQREVLLERAPDTTRVWYEYPAAATWDIFLQQDTLFMDTVAVRATKRDAFLEKAALKLLRMEGGQKQHPVQPAQFVFNHPISFVDTAFVRLLEDTSRARVPLRGIQVDTNGQRVLSIDYRWKEGRPYELLLLPGALVDIFGLSNDSLSTAFAAGEAKDYGNLFLSIDSLDQGEAYLVELLDKEELKAAFRVADTASFSHAFELMPPGVYTLRITADSNRNGRWDPGEYNTGQQAEFLYQRDLEQLRANWDLDVSIDFQQMVAEMAQKLAPRPLSPPRVARPAADSTSSRSTLPPSVRDRIDGN